MSLPEKNFLETQHIVKQYAKQYALSDVSISVPEGAVYGLLGPNGAGKTSLIRIITQITGPDSGNILFRGRPLQPHDVSQIGYMPEERGLYKKMKVGEQLLYLAQLKGMSLHDAKVSLKTWVETFEIGTWWNKRLEELSKGMQQKIQFISTIVHNPPLLILDEPFSGFDPLNAQVITQELLKLRDSGTTIILSTHRMETVEELCTHFSLINKSRKIIEGEVESIKDQFRTHTYKLNIKASATLVAPDGGKIISDMALKNNTRELILSIPTLESGNSILSHYMNQGEVISFSEIIPSISDIFISLVKDSNLE